MFEAVQANDVSALKRAIDGGANKDAKDGNGRKALAYAKHKRHKDIVVLLD